MKRKKFIALLCVAATSASLVTPVMAEENQAVEAVQETAVEQETTGQETTKQEAPAGEVPVEEGAEEKEIPAEEAEEPVEEAALIPEESTAENPKNETSEATNTELIHILKMDCMRKMEKFTITKMVRWSQIK